jgi:hypothetical protein
MVTLRPAPGRPCTGTSPSPARTSPNSSPARTRISAPAAGPETFAGRPGRHTGRCDGRNAATRRASPIARPQTAASRWQTQERSFPKGTTGRDGKAVTRDFSGHVLTATAATIQIGQFGAANSQHRMPVVAAERRLGARLLRAPRTEAQSGHGGADSGELVFLCVANSRRVPLLPPTPRAVWLCSARARDLCS